MVTKNCRNKGHQDKILLISWTQRPIEEYEMALRTIIVIIIVRTASLTSSSQICQCPCSNFTIQLSIQIFVYIFKVCFLRVRTSARLSTIYSPCPLALGFVYFDDFVAITTHFSHFCHSNSFVGTLKTCEHAEIRHGNGFSCNNTQFNILDWMLTQYPKVIAVP